MSGPIGLSAGQLYDPTNIPGVLQSQPVLPFASASFYGQGVYPTPPSVPNIRGTLRVPITFGPPELLDNLVVFGSVGSALGPPALALVVLPGNLLALIHNTADVNVNAVTAVALRNWNAGESTVLEYHWDAERPIDGTFHATVTVVGAEVAYVDPRPESPWLFWASEQIAVAMLPVIAPGFLDFFNGEVGRVQFSPRP